MSSCLSISVSLCQRIGVHILKGSGVVSILQCMFAAMYTLFLIWRGMKSYSTSYKKDYITVMQVQHSHLQTPEFAVNGYFMINAISETVCLRTQKNIQIHCWKTNISAFELSVCEIRKLMQANLWLIIFCQENKYIF